MITTPKLTHDRLIQVMEYDAKTGLFRWKIKLGKGHVGEVAGSPDNVGYIRIMIDGERFLAHRLAWFYVRREWPKHQIDHINVNNSDNRYENLREATQQQNQANRGLQRNNSTGYKGVSFNKRQNKFFARIKINNKLIHLGSYENAEEAHQAYAVAANDRFGDFARVA